MNAAFADAFYFIALLNTKDQYHDRVETYSRGPHRNLVTTEWVLVELADALASLPDRSRTAGFIEKLPRLPSWRVIRADSALLHRGLELYAARVDKAWSLTDCISFVVMKEEGLQEALTGDRHFIQAGFTALFA